jgi:hypothetical protein
MRELAAVLEQFRGISLEELDERAALLRRVDNKYAVPWERFLALIDRLREDHAVLDIDGRRQFSYETTYFETPDLRCFRDHVGDRRPRFKARTRCYLETGSCVFEVRLKQVDGETDKRQIGHPVDRRRELTDAARSCLGQALADVGLDPPSEMAPAIHTSFRRVTFAADLKPERLTCDLDVCLSSQDGDSAKMRDGLVLVETKSERGESPADAVLAELGLEPISLSKYRVAMGLLMDVQQYGPQPGSELFERVRTGSRQT